MAKAEYVAKYPACKDEVVFAKFDYTSMQMTPTLITYRDISQGRLKLDRKIFEEYVCGLDANDEMVYLIVPRTWHPEPRLLTFGRSSRS